MKRRVIEARGDFSGGLNRAAITDAVAANELSMCVNARVEPGGHVSRREGAKKTHTTAIGGGANIMGLFYWEPAGAGQLVAISNGKLYYAAAPYSSWTEITPASGTFSTSFMSDFATFRDGATLNLYIATNGLVYRWDGAAVVRIDGTAGVPDASCVRAFGNRLFMNSIANPKTLYWSVIGDGDNFATGGLSGGGSALVDSLGGDALTGLEVSGSSVLLLTHDSIARFSGVGEDIQISQDSFGVSRDIGMKAAGSTFIRYQQAFTRVEQSVLLWTQRGPYIVSEGGIAFLGEKIQNIPLDADNSPHYGESISLVGHNPWRREVWFFYTDIGDSEAQEALIYNYAMKKWVGQFRWGFAVTSCAAVQSTEFRSAQQIFVGCSDGFVRRLDADLLDGTTRLDDGTTDYTTTIRPGPFLFAEAGPHMVKSLRHVFVELQRGDITSTFAVNVIPDGGSPVAAVLVSTQGAAETPANFRYDVNVRGRRLEVELVMTDATLSTDARMSLMGMIVQGSAMERV